METSVLIRVVRLEFALESLPEFLDLFEETKTKIAAFEGCEGVLLKRDPSFEQVRYTLSFWKSQEALEAYRNSILFKETWAKTKTWFSAKPQAWSLIQ